MRRADANGREHYGQRCWYAGPVGSFRAETESLATVQEWYGGQTEALLSEMVTTSLHSSSQSNQIVEIPCRTPRSASPRSSC